MSDPRISIGTPQQLPRKFVNDENVQSIYTDSTVTADLGDSIVVHFFQTQLGVPDERGTITDARALLKAKVILSLAHAKLLHTSLSQLIENREKST